MQFIGLIQREIAACFRIRIHRIDKIYIRLSYLHNWCSYIDQMGSKIIRTLESFQQKDAISSVEGFLS